MNMEIFFCTTPFRLFFSKVYLKEYSAPKKCILSTIEMSQFIEPEIHIGFIGNQMTFLFICVVHKINVLQCVEN